MGQQSLSHTRVPRKHLTLNLHSSSDLYPHSVVTYKWVNFNTKFLPFNNTQYHIRKSMYNNFLQPAVTGPCTIVASLCSSSERFHNTCPTFSTSRVQCSGCNGFNHSHEPSRSTVGPSHGPGHRAGTTMHCFNLIRRCCCWWFVGCFGKLITSWVSKAWRLALNWARVPAHEKSRHRSDSESLLLYAVQVSATGGTCSRVDVFLAATSGSAGCKQGELPAATGQTSFTSTLSIPPQTSGSLYAYAKCKLANGTFVVSAYVPFTVTNPNPGKLAAIGSVWVTASCYPGTCARSLSRSGISTAAGTFMHMRLWYLAPRYGLGDSSRTQAEAGYTAALPVVLAAMLPDNRLSAPHLLLFLVVPAAVSSGTAAAEFWPPILAIPEPRAL